MREGPKPRRHDLVWLTAAGVSAAHAVGGCCGAGRGEGDDAEALLASWAAADRPLIVTRQAGDEAPGWIRLGLALPPSLGKRRLAFRAPIDGIARAAPPLHLGDAVHALPAAWQPTLRALLGAPDIVAARPRLYGSAAMQAVTGVECLGQGSDLDLLLAPSDWPAALAAVRALATLDDGTASPRIDGEIRNSAGESVAWRELAGSSPRVLSKGSRDVRLIGRAAFAASFREAEVAA